MNLASIWLPLKKLASRTPSYFAAAASSVAALNTFQYLPQGAEQMDPGGWKIALWVLEGIVCVLVGRCKYITYLGRHRMDTGVYLQLLHKGWSTPSARTSINKLNTPIATVSDALERCREGAMRLPPADLGGEEVRRTRTARASSTRGTMAASRASQGATFSTATQSAGRNAMSRVPCAPRVDPHPLARPRIPSRRDRSRPARTAGAPYVTSPGMALPSTGAS